MSAFSPRFWRSGVLAGLISALTISGVAAADRIAAAALGGAAAEIVWVPEDGNWPAGGWRLERVGRTGATVIARQIGPGLDAAALAGLTREEAAGLMEFATKLRQGTLTPDEKAAADAVLILGALIRPAYGRALGVRFRDSDVPAGDTFYRLTALAPNGASLRSAESDTIDAGSATPLPFAPEAAAAQVRPEGIVLAWDEPPSNAVAPIIGYRVVRAEPNGPTDLTPDLVLRSAGASSSVQQRLTLADRDGSRDRASVYELSSIDLFGRASLVKRVEVSLGTLALAVPPTGVAVTPGIAAATVTWTPVPHAGVAGYVVERSLFAGGPYEALTPDGLPPAVSRLESRGLSPGTAYYFRVRVFDGDGNLGVPSLPAKAVPAAAGPPPAPINLAADAGPNAVQLIWEQPGPVAGYFVYRRLEGEERWSRLNGTITTELAYVDRFDRGAFNNATLNYRIQAIGLDNQAGTFSSAVAVKFGDILPPPAPAITAVTGEGGAARLSFVPGAPEDETTGFAVLRADGDNLPGRVIADILPGSARSFDDAEVTAGSTYWYEVVAVDAAGNRSDPSNRVAVNVGAPTLPQPPPPRATFHATPFPYVELTLSPPPPRIQAFVEAQSAGGKWLVVAGPLADITSVNLTDIPAGTSRLAYRVVYLASNGARGAPSAVVEVAIR